MATLTDDQKAYIVCLLSGFESPSAVAARFQDELGVEIHRSQVIRYDPTKPCYEGGERWRSVFHAARKTYLESIETIPIAHKAYRLNELQRIYDKASRTGNLVLATATLRQAAEEAGGALTNEQNIRVTSRIDAMTPEERRIEFEELLRKALNWPALDPAKAA